ncbi:MAG TPA: Slp family lipoprotein, partial [Geobacteraceae bacterium]
RLVTLVGEIKGKKTRPLDYVDYTYPVVSIKELHLLKGYQTDEEFPYPPPPPYYDPYYFGHWPDVYWFRPLGPPFRPDHR